MFPRCARASALDSLRFNLFHVLPMALQGVFRKRPFWVGVVGALHPDPLGRRFVARLRTKYHAACVDLSMLGRRTRLVLDSDGIRDVLERSPDPYADPRSKRDGMAIFQPNAATISRMPVWAVRRHFNDLVFAAAACAPLDGHILSVVRNEVQALGFPARGRLTSADLQTLFNRITLRVVFGDAARTDDAVLADLDVLMSRANRVVFRRRSRRAFARLNAATAGYVRVADPNSLVGAGRQILNAPAVWPGGQIPLPGDVAAEGQVPHWLFAMKDTLAANTAFALALLAAHPAVDRAVRVELPHDRDVTAADLHAARLLEGTIQEGMRLWPTTPMLLREAAAAGVLGGDVHRPGVQVLVWNAASHRDAAVVSDPDGFVPGRWAAGDVNWQFNHLSNGRQGCAGKRLALFVGKAVVAEVGRLARLTLTRPRLAADAPLPETFNWFRFECAADAL